MNARKISDAILNNIDFSGNEHIMDFGAGTGLLSEGLADKVEKITAIDYSGAMLEKFYEKDWPCEIDVINIDLTKATLDYQFDGIVSSMTLHHIEDIDTLFQKFSQLLKNGGFIGLADLYKEAGDFHDNNESVEHFGFEETELIPILEKHGFSSIKFEQVNVITKDKGDQKKDYPIFLISAFYLPE